jgi:hypothetical protein
MRFHADVFLNEAMHVMIPEFVLTNRFDITIKRKQYVIGGRTDRRCARLFSV